MSIFKKPFAPKKAPARKNITLSPLKLDASERAREFGLDYGSAYLKLSGQLVRFDKETGDWISGMRTSFRLINYLIIHFQDGTHYAGSKDVQKLQKLNHHLQEENNLLKVKFDLLLDMATEVYCENKLQEQQLKQPTKKQ